MLPPTAGSSGRAAMDGTRQIAELVEEYRGRCPWFLDAHYVPETPEAILRVLGHIERYGDRRAFLEVPELKKWVLRNSSDASAVS